MSADSQWAIAVYAVTALGVAAAVTTLEPAFLAGGPLLALLNLIRSEVR